MKKVFCKNCKFLEQKFVYNSSPISPNNQWVCSHHSNTIKTSLEINWFQQISEIKYKQKPEEINKNNDCKYYKEVKSGK